MGFYLKEELKKAEILVDESFFECCDIFAKRLLSYSKTHNITALKTKEEIERNIFDSIYPIKFLPPLKKILDIGTGAGFPGLVLSFALKKSEIFLSEPILKRSAFLYLIKSECSLKNVKILNRRVEEIEPFKADLITSRAVSNTEKLLSLGKRFCKKESMFLFYKGEGVKEEIKFLKDYKIYEREKRKYLLVKGCYDI